MSKAFSIIFILLLAGCACRRQIVLSSAECALPKIYVKEDGTRLLNRPPLTARVETKRDDSRIGYVVIYDDDMIPVYADTFVGTEPQFHWLKVSSQDNMLLFIYDGGGTGGVNFEVIKFAFSNHSSFESKGTNVLVRARVAFSDQYYGGEVKIVNDSEGNAVNLDYFIRDYDKGPGNQIFKTLRLEDIIR